MQRKQKGFTLIELMAAVLVFSIMLLIMGRIFSDSARAMKVGMQSAEANSSGRAVMEFISREISMALVDDQVGLYKYESMDDGLYFVSLSGEVAEEDVPESDTPDPAKSKRKPIELQYQLVSFPGDAVSGRYTRNQLKRKRNYQVGTITAYHLDRWWTSFSVPENQYGIATLLDNVYEFDVTLCTTNGAVKAEYDSTKDGPPVYADIFLSLLGEEAAIEYDSLAAGAAKDRYVQNNLQYYFRRVYLKNMDGYNRAQR